MPIVTLGALQLRISDAVCELTAFRLKRRLALHTLHVCPLIGQDK